jgi:phosphate transport system ATP-binding protein
MTIIDIKSFSFTYAKSSQPALKNINLQIKKGQITALIGASGCGKSTLLRSLNRIHDLYPNNTYSGEIWLKSRDKKMENILELKSEKELINLRQRVGMIFQKPTPFPMSIFENIAYGLRIAGVDDKYQLEERVKNALKGAFLWEEVKDKLNKSANDLSGGQQQRLCIARAIAVEPEILLFDEPTSALDPISTKAIEELILELKNKITVVIVTHNLQQAKRVSDFTALFYLGDLIEYDKTENIFSNPREKKTKEYISGEFG